MAGMIGLYLQEILQLVHTVKQAIAEKDWQTWEGATHSHVCHDEHEPGIRGQRQSYSEQGG